MNPLGISSAVLDIIIDSAKSKTQKETKRERIYFVCSYLALMTIGSLLLVWTVWTLYFKK